MLWLQHRADGRYLVGLVSNEMDQHFVTKQETQSFHFSKSNAVELSGQWLVMLRGLP
jgi:hypothetical protein